MARILATQKAGNHPGSLADPGATTGTPQRGVYFRALVDLGTGSVAGIEAASAGTAQHARTDTLSRQPPEAWGMRPNTANLSAWGREVREPAAYLVRGGPQTQVRDVVARLGISPDRLILMYDVTVLPAHPTQFLDVLLIGKRAGARILLDLSDLDDPPIRFLEMLPADILRVAPRRMPWHWDAERRQQALESLLDFAGNLLMDVAVEGVDSSGERRALRRLGVRYAQGAWRRDALGLIPDPALL